MNATKHRLLAGTFVLALGPLLVGQALAGAYGDLIEANDGKTLGVPTVNGPSCVSNCGGQTTTKQATTRQTNTRQTDTRQQDSYRAPAPQKRVMHHHTSSTKSAAMQGIKQGLSKPYSVSPQALEQANQQKLQGAQMLQEAQHAQQQALEAQSQQAARDAQDAHSRKTLDLANSLQGMPNTSGDLSGLKPGLPASQQPLNTDLEALRAGAGSGFDTAGKFIGKYPVAEPPKVSPPTPVAASPQEREKKLKRLKDEGKLSAALQKMLQERDENLARKRQLEQELSRLESKGGLTPEEKVEVAKLKQDVSTAQNKDNFYSFSINDSLEQVQ